MILCQLINTNQNVVFIMPDFLETTLCQKDKKKIWCCVDGLCIVLKSEGHPEGDPINMIRTEAFLCLVSIHSGMKYVKPSLDSLNTHTIWCRICVNQNNIYFYVRSLLLSEFFVNYSYNYLILQP